MNYSLTCNNGLQSDHLFFSFLKLILGFEYQLFSVIYSRYTFYLKPSALNNLFNKSLRDMFCGVYSSAKKKDPL